MFEDYPKYKFRAPLSEVDGGGYVTGSLIYRYGKTYIEDAINHNTYRVDEDKVVLLVGYIADGAGVREVYDGDEIVLDGGGTGYASVIRFIKTEKNSFDEFNECAKKYGWKLKK